MNLLDPLGWAIVLLVLGCGLLVLEVFIPSGGIFGFLAALAVMGSLFMGFRRNMTTGLSFMAIAVFAVPIVVGLAFKYWPKTPMGKAFLGAVPDEHDVKPEDPRRSLVGRVGIAQSKMLPSGSVLIDGQYVDAVSQGLAIDQGEPVIVVEVRANRVMVRPARAHEVRTADIRPDDLLSRPAEEFGLEGLDELNERAGS
jgi:membrane-bound serine protease (ClpP class)